MKKLKLVISTILILSSCTDVKTVVEQISQNNLLESEYIGFRGSESNEFRRFKKLSEIASNKELKQLSINEHPIVRTYAFQIMLNRNLIESDKAFKLALLDNEAFGTLNADIIGHSDICTEIYFSTLNKYPRFEEGEMEHIVIQNEEMNKLDSLIIFEIEEDHFLHYMALNNKVHNSNLNARIMELALNKRVPSAINYINNNKIKTDIIEMIKSIEYVLENKFLGSEPENKMRLLLKKLKND